jgi:hypothetical protein
MSIDTRILPRLFPFALTWLSAFVDSSSPRYHVPRFPNQNNYPDAAFRRAASDTRVITATMSTTPEPRNMEGAADNSVSLDSKRKSRGKNTMAAM